jgi:lipoyl synthase
VRVPTGFASDCSTPASIPTPTDMTTAPLHVRWLGRVPYDEAYALQRALFEHGRDASHLLLLEHPHVYTLGVRADRSNVLVDPATVGAALVEVDRGGDVTYHGPGQLVGYPILRRPARKGGMAETVTYVREVEQVVIDALCSLGLTNVGRLREYPGVWVDPESDAPRKIAAIGVKLTRGRTLHGFAINVNTDLSMFGHIIPCGIAGKAVTSLAVEGIEVTMRDVADAIVDSSTIWGVPERQDVAWKHDANGRDLSAFSRGEGAGEPVRLTGRMAQAGVTDGLSIATRKPEWMRVKTQMSGRYLDLKKTMRSLDLVTVCEEAGCPNIHECWNDGTATFMVLGERCTRACGFCLVDTSKPTAPSADEPQRIAVAVDEMGLDHVVLTMVARDDLADGGMAHVAACVEAIRLRRPAARIETLISDAKGDDASLALLFAARPDVMNHNIETVPRLQRAVRPSAGYARSLAVLARAKAAGLTTKTGMVLGMGETDDEVIGVLHDLAAMGVDIVTLGQYLRPTTHHVAIHRWVEPATFARYKEIGEALGIAHVESSPLTRSSYHAKTAADAATVPISFS